MRWALQTARLRLRPATDDDAAGLHTHWNNADVGRYLFDGAAVAPETVDALVARSHADFDRSGFGLWVIEDRATEAFVGMSGLAKVDGHELIELLYSVEPAWWGKGIATEAAEAVVRYAFTGAGLDLVVGGVDEPNAASRRVLERLGFRPYRTLEVLGRTVPYYAATTTAPP